MPPRRLLWFFGPSGAGKKTSVLGAARDERHPLRPLMGLGERVIAVESALVGSTRSEEEMVAELSRLATRDGCLLIKGQWVDIARERDLPLPTAVSELFPDAQHEVVFLWARPGELHRRCGARGYAQRAEANGHAEELQDQIERVGQLGLPITWLRTSDGAFLNERPQVA